jgi:hypothetical protein
MIHAPFMASVVCVVEIPTEILSVLFACQALP